MQNICVEFYEEDICMCGGTRGARDNKNVMLFASVDYGLRSQQSWLVCVRDVEMILYQKTRGKAGWPGPTCQPMQTIHGLCWSCNCARDMVVQICMNKHVDMGMYHRIVGIGMLSGSMCGPIL